MANFNALLDRKYDILNKHAEAALLRARAAAGLDNTQASAVRAEAARKAQPVNLPGLRQLLGSSASPGLPPLPPSSAQTDFGLGPAVPDATAPLTPGVSQQPRTTSTAPAGFGLSLDGSRPRGVSSVFGSLFGEARGF